MDAAAPVVTQSRDISVNPINRAREDRAIYRAIQIINKRLQLPGEAMRSPQSVRDFLGLTLADEEREHFLVMLLDAQHRMIKFMTLFSGTLTQTAVYPREVVKFALLSNAAAVIIAHNHPSGYLEPSASDIDLTRNIKAALSLVDTMLLDHMIVAKGSFTSFAERGLL